MWHAYILLCADGQTYTGCTDDLKDRLSRHQKGHVPATANRLPIKIICYITFASKYRAYEFEKYLKSGSGRAFMRRHLI